MVKPVVQRSVGLPSLTLVLLIIGLLTSRVTLVLHEFVGHAGTAALFGSRIARYHLFLFAGGYVDVARDAPYSVAEHLAIYLGGLALELAIGVALLAWARRLRAGSLARLALVGFGAINLVHAGFYFAAGTFHGYGDGWMLHHLLGSSRTWIVLPVCAALLPLTYLLARTIAASLRSWMPDRSPRTCAALIAGAMVIAASGHAALAFGELAISPSAVYGSTMRHESERKVRRDVSAYARTLQRTRGIAPTADQLARARKAARRRHKQFPLQWVLAVLLAAAAGMGIWRAPHGAAATAPGPRAIATLAAVLGGALLMIGLLKLIS